MKVMVVLGTAMVALLVAIVMLLRSANMGPYSLTPFPKWAISSAFNGDTNPLQNPRLEIECRGFDCEAVVPHLPAVSSVRCIQDLGPVGACCNVRFGTIMAREVHVWWKGIGKYRISLTRPWCRNPDFQQTAATHTPDPDAWVYCDVLWRSSPPAQDRAPNNSDSSPPSGGKGG